MRKYLFLLIPAISAGGLCEKCDPMFIGSCEGDMTCHDDFKICISKSSSFDPNSCREISSDVFNTVCPDRCDSIRERCKLITVDGQSTPTCVCRTQFHYSKVSRTCVTDEEDPQCTSDNNCGRNQKCDLETMSCVCKQGYMTDRNNPEDCVQQCGSHMTLDFDAAITKKIEPSLVSDQDDGGEIIVFWEKRRLWWRCRKYKKINPTDLACYWSTCFCKDCFIGTKNTRLGYSPADGDISIPIGRRRRNAEENRIVEIEGSQQEDDNTVRFRPNICDPDATCMTRSLLNSTLNHCKCNEGFTGNGVRCYNVERCQDYCNEHIPGSSCHGHDETNWSCKCPPESVLVHDNNGNKQCVIRPICAEGCPKHAFCDREDDRCQCQLPYEMGRNGRCNLGEYDNNLHDTEEENEDKLSLVVQNSCQFVLCSKNAHCDFNRHREPICVCDDGFTGTDGRNCRKESATCFFGSCRAKGEIGSYPDFLVDHGKQCGDEGLNLRCGEEGCCECADDFVDADSNASNGCEAYESPCDNGTDDCREDAVCVDFLEETIPYDESLQCKWHYRRDEYPHKCCRVWSYDRQVCRSHYEETNMDPLGMPMDQWPTACCESWFIIGSGSDSLTTDQHYTCNETTTISPTTTVQTTTQFDPEKECPFTDGTGKKELVQWKGKDNGVIIAHSDDSAIIKFNYFNTAAAYDLVNGDYIGFLGIPRKLCGSDVLNKINDGTVQMSFNDFGAFYDFQHKYLRTDKEHSVLMIQIFRTKVEGERDLPGFGDRKDQVWIALSGLKNVDWGPKDWKTCLTSIQAGTMMVPDGDVGDFTKCVAWDINLGYNG